VVVEMQKRILVREKRELIGSWEVRMTTTRRTLLGRLNSTSEGLERKKTGLKPKRQN